MDQRSKPPAGQQIKAPSSPYGLIVLLTLAAGLVFLDRYSIGFLFPQIKADLNLDSTRLGALMSVTSLTWAVSSVACAYVSDALGGRPKLIIAGCIVGFSVAIGLMGATSSFTTLLLLRGLIGVFEGPVFPLIQATVARCSPTQQRGANLGLVFVGTTLIGGAAAPMIVLGLAADGWRSAFFYLAAPGFVMALILWFAMPSDRLRTGGVAAPRPTFGEVLNLLRDRTLVLAMVGTIALVGVMLTMQGFLTLTLSADPTMTPKRLRTILVILGVGSALGAIVAPALSDRFARKPCLLLSTLCVALAPLAVLLAPAHPGFIAAAFVLQFIGGGALAMMVFVVPGDIVPARLAATTYAILLAVGEMVGGSLTPLGAGALADRFGTPAALMLGSAVGLVAVLAALGMREPDRQAVAARSAI